MKTVLIPYDFTESSESALRYGTGLAAYLGAKLLLLHIHQLPLVSHEPGPDIYSLSELFRDRDQAISALAGKITESEPAIDGITHYSETGHPADVIIEFSQAHQVDFIISGIGGHGNSLIKNFVGSTSVDVARQSNRATVIVPPGITYRKIKNIAYACDYDPRLLNNSSLAQVKYINTLFDATLHILHVIPEHHELSAKESIIDNYVEEAMGKVCHKTYLISENTVADGLLNFIRHHDIDLIILEPKEHSLLHKLFSFSTINAMAFYSPVPVLAIHG